jgi:hypothetical protein
MSQRDPTDDLGPDEVVEPSGYEPPRILRAVELNPTSSRRRFLVASLAAGALTTEGCANSVIDITAENGECTCHTVCVCDVDTNETTSESVRESEYSGGGCTCDTVCSCDSVCTCDSQSSGGSYWY